MFSLTLWESSKFHQLSHNWHTPACVPLAFSEHKVCPIYSINVWLWQLSLLTACMILSSYSVASSQLSLSIASNLAEWYWVMFQTARFIAGIRQGCWWWPFSITYHTHLAQSSLSTDQGIASSLPSTVQYQKTTSAPAPHFSSWFGTKTFWLPLLCCFFPMIRQCAIFLCNQIIQFETFNCTVWSWIFL